MADAAASDTEPTVEFDGKHIRLVRKGKWEYATRKGVAGIVGIIAVTDDEKLILVEQFRCPLGKRVIELPAGLAGDVEGSEDEALADAARRELLEETGYEAGEMEYLAAGAASAGMTDEIITLFRARGLTKRTEGGGEGSEQIVVHTVSVSGVEPWLAHKVNDGYVIDLKVYCGLYFAANRQ